MGMVDVRSRRLQLILLVSGIVGVNVASGLLLKTLADHASGWLITGIGFSIVFLLNGARLVIWLLANRRFPLSTTYPLTSLFFPIMLGISYAYGEPVNLLKIVGTLLIASGVFWLGWRMPRSTAAETAG
jgi:multidrug transporter EmrE-like cation transporter